MKKDIEWLKKEIEEYLAYEGVRYARIALESVLGYIDQLDEPETLSQEWIDENKVVRINDVRKMTTSDVVKVEKLKNLLVPKQEVTEEQVMHWLDNNEFYDHATAETVLANAVDRGELGYYGTKYSVVEKTVIPKFVAEWIEAHNLYGNNPLREYRDLENDFNEGWTDEKDAAVYHWINKNPYAFIDALRYGYKPEKEKLYQVELPTERLHHILTMHGDGKGHFFGKQHTNNFWYKTYLTEQEIKAIDERYWAFAQEVTE